ncbi:MAG: RecX family transcriptional regulator [Prevotella sp.]|nr:RecX family transcriptional regulator [Prevotella sp.]MBP8935650.1 RecX family transcriptional regulator [Prevotella sp.]
MKQISEKEAQLKLSSLCAQGEHCTQDLIDKLNKWEIPEDAQARIMEYLTKNKFVDDARFCVAFVKDKIKYNGWGRKKVEQALYIKRIPRSMSDPVFEEIPDEMYLEKLRPLIKQKYPTIKARNEYERAMKLIKFAMGRGFDMRIIRMCIDEAEELADD